MTSGIEVVSKAPTRLGQSPPPPKVFGFEVHVRPPNRHLFTLVYRVASALIAMVSAVLLMFIIGYGAIWSGTRSGSWVLAVGGILVLALLVFAEHLRTAVLDRLTVERERKLADRTAAKLLIGVSVKDSIEAFDEAQARRRDGQAAESYQSKPLYDILKRSIDLGLTVVMLLMVAPAAAMIAVLIKLDSPGPVLFSQQRIGRDGRHFRMLKFRTMIIDAAPYARVHAPVDTDQRVTRVGRLLRAAGLDELPQLVNVLRGEMSLVGPRPEMPFIVNEYGETERQRLLVRPGITGLWQLSPDRSTEVHDNLKYDLYYVSRRSSGLDLVILARTVWFALVTLKRM